MDWSLLPPTTHPPTSVCVCVCTIGIHRSNTVCCRICVQLMGATLLPPTFILILFLYPPSFKPRPSLIYLFIIIIFFIRGLSVRLILLFPSLGCQLGVWSHFLKAAVPEDGKLIELWPFSEWVKNRINAELLKPAWWGKKEKLQLRKCPMGEGL